MLCRRWEDVDVGTIKRMNWGSRKYVDAGIEDEDGVQFCVTYRYGTRFIDHHHIVVLEDDIDNIRCD